MTNAEQKSFTKPSMLKLMLLLKLSLMSSPSNSDRITMLGLKDDEDNLSCVVCTKRKAE